MKSFLIKIILVTLALNSSAQQLSLPNAPIKFLALGNSYTIGESVKPKERWPTQLSDSLAARGFNIESTKIIATTGWRTDDLLSGIRKAMPKPDYNLVGLLIGVNNQYQGRSLAQYYMEFPQLLDSAIVLAGGDTNLVFVLSIPDYAYTPFGKRSNPKKISAELDLYNSIADSITSVYDIPFFNITPISRQGIVRPELVAKDGLHPSGSQYTEWVKILLQSFVRTKN